MIEVEIDSSFSGFDLDCEAIEVLVRFICEAYDVVDAVVSVAVIDHEKTCEINAQYLNHEGTTDCFSFDLTDETEKRSHFEVIVNGELAVEQAQLRGHSAQAELALYITHGMLHNLGHDDLQADKAKAMHEEEDRILLALGYGTVYQNKIQ